MPVDDLLKEIDAQIQDAEDNLIRLRNARAALANNRTGRMDHPVVVGAAVEGLPITQAIRQVLQWNLDRGKEAMSVGDVFAALRPYTITTANGKSMWESELPWKVFVIACTSPHNRRRYWSVTKAISGDRAKLLKNDTIRLNTVKKPLK